MSTRENIRLIARAPLHYREVTYEYKKKIIISFFFLSQGDVSFTHTKHYILWIIFKIVHKIFHE